jgi:hypothetical protein
MRFLNMEKFYIFMSKFSQIENISTKFHKHATTTLHFTLYRLISLLFSFKFWYTHSYRAFIHFGNINIFILAYLLFYTN